MKHPCAKGAFLLFNFCVPIIFTNAWPDLFSAICFNPQCLLIIFLHIACFFILNLFRTLSRITTRIEED